MSIQPGCRGQFAVRHCGEHGSKELLFGEEASMPVDRDHPALLDVSASMEMTHETMMARWRRGLVTPMSPTISTFAKTDGSWWTASQVMWRRVSLAEDNERLDFHHDRFGSVNQAKGPATTADPSPWDKRPPQSLFRSQAPQLRNS